MGSSRRTTILLASLGAILAVVLSLAMYQGRRDDGAPAPDIDAGSESPDASSERIDQGGDAATGPRVFVLAINGGGSPETNYKSHLLHLRNIAALISEAGLPRDRVIVLSSDGSDPAADVAARRTESGREAWRFRGTKLEDQFGPKFILEDSQIEGPKLFPATRGALSIWSLTVGQQLEPGDTLLLYVTDHGSKGEQPERNRITLWGNDSISVRGVRRLLDSVRPGVRVVALMSQCFSGGFAGLYNLHSPDEALPSGDFCGFFSSTADRPAYGCYPETRDKEELGHSFVFLRSLRAAGGSFDQAHQATVERDDTPDSPVKTSDIFLRHLLDREARRSAIPVDSYVDRVLRAAEENPSVALERKTILSLGETFGVPAMLTKGELNREVDALTALARKLGGADENLRRLQDRTNRDLLARFLAARPAWGPRVAPDALTSLAPDKRQRLAEDMSAELSSFDAEEQDGYPSRINRMRDDLHGLSYRTNVRLGVYKRMGTLLDTIAAKVVLERLSTKEREAFAALSECERFSLGLPGGGGAEVSVPRKLPEAALDAQLATAVLQQAADPAGRPQPLPVGTVVRALEDLVPYRGSVSTPSAGRPILLFFWATWCEACKVVLPEVMQIAERQGLEILAISDESRETLDTFFSQTEVAFPALVARDPSRQTIDRFGVQALPTLVVLDAKGAVANVATTQLKGLPRFPLAARGVAQR